MYCGIEGLGTKQRSHQGGDIEWMMMRIVLTDEGMSDVMCVCGVGWTIRPVVCWWWSVAVSRAISIL